ncbi:peptidoglycan-binding protein LysM [Actinomyces sp. ZJ308]|uniref:LysM peptidoglycan-binding domain-containing protein n=1 Tax=Actinomyces sp. ZJ308 TaxID=2708342 RepID=UPI0014246D55|nr:peptidoglycan-binding protein LysM [Actinomyces sp. ZJ308]
MGARLRLALLAGVSGVLLVLLGYAARSSTASLLEVGPQSWGMTHLSDAVVAGTCTIGALGALWHLASAVLALVALTGPRDRRPSRRGGGPGPADRILDAWGAPAVRRIAASALVVSLSSAPALAAEEASDEDDLGWRPTSSAPASPSQTPSPTPSSQADQSPPSSAGGPEGTQSPAEDVTPSPSQTPSDGSGEPSDSVPPSTPDRPVSTAPDGQAPSERTHTVLPGESLWSITAGLLPAGAGPAQVARTWPVLYRANADAIGPNPSLIRPGAVLSVPDSLAAPPTTTGGQPPSR